LSLFLSYFPNLEASVLTKEFLSVIPLSIVGAHHFYDTLNNFLSLIGYWASAFTIIILEEHFLFRRGKASSYDVSTWNTARELPTGIASLGAGILSMGLVVPSIDQVWFVGPIAKHTGDIGFELAFAVTMVLYPPFRWLEIRIRQKI
jgi:purine-cytosine permease-like protein